LGTRLTPLVESAAIGGFESPARFLPSIATQEARRASLPPADMLRTRLGEALAGLPLSAARLEPFVSDVQRARSGPLLSQADLAGTSFGSLVDALLVRTASGWSALLPVAARGSADLSPDAVAAIRAAVAGSGVRAELLDLKTEADRLYSRYLSDAMRLAFGGLIAIVVLLSVSLRSLRRMMRVVAPLALSVFVVAAGLVALGHALTILHLVGMLLIVAVGSNYALFFDRVAAHPQEGSVPLTLASLLVANLATVLAFGVLASSTVPVLADLGSTVAPGTILALLFAAMLAKPAALAPIEARRA